MHSSDGLRPELRVPPDPWLVRVAHAGALGQVVGCQPPGIRSKSHTVHVYAHYLQENRDFTYSMPS
jgi:hypothetical protein